MLPLTVRGMRTRFVRVDAQGDPVRQLFRAVLAFACVVVAVEASAQSAKHTLQVSSLTLITETSSPTPGWVEILGSE